ncbi:hypothetical protein CS0771_44650 [Catellatospora sp. IY07-71]|uniref:class I SAM-dependent methyltransferase n=1 Tax=Catellatospora sp. IY07-71 TaxID=2728827 RepID=UPI001BB37101|nr:class I SAM-dependent methyltransferase [Catellatospora sp. IY07-71]BCJ74921.1 hypothetical protein CS0771_44650 [Catellatospora sp. IY07-71]
MPGLIRDGNLYTGAPTGWTHAEARRLRRMDELLAAVTTADLTPVLAAVRASEQPVRLLDVGAGTGTTVEDLCTTHGVAYYVLDASGPLLAARATDPARKVRGRAEHLPLAGGSFALTFSRAVLAWCGDPRAAIREQLRVTAPGGTALFTEFDWTRAGLTARSQALADGMAARAAMMGALIQGGFAPRYGARLGADVDAVTAGTGCVREQRVVELPAGDHRAVFLDAARTVIAHLRGLKAAPAATAAMFLESYAAAVDDPANVIELRLPALVTQLVSVPA